MTLLEAKCFSIHNLLMLLIKTSSFTCNKNVLMRYNEVDYILKVKLPDFVHKFFGTVYYIENRREIFNYIIFKGILIFSWKIFKA